MQQYSNVEKAADVHFVYGIVSGNATVVIRMYQERYLNRAFPDRRTFQCLHRELVETDSKLTDPSCSSNKEHHSDKYHRGHS